MLTGKSIGVGMAIFLVILFILLMLSPSKANDELNHETMKKASYCSTMHWMAMQYIRARQTGKVEWEYHRKRLKYWLETFKIAQKNAGVPEKEAKMLDKIITNRTIQEVNSPAKFAELIGPKCGSDARGVGTGERS